jgi:hypothetical protein
MENKTFLKINLQVQKPLYANDREYHQFRLEKTFLPSEVGILLVGLWDTHNCLIAQNILDQICPEINKFITRYRGLGSKVILGSSSLGGKPEYRKYRQAIKGVGFSTFKDYGMNYPPLPFDDSFDGGIEEPNPDFVRSNVKLHPSIQLDDNDLISGNAKEIVNYLNHHHIKHLLVVGAHLNMCILDRPYAIRNLLRYGVNVSIVRDLVDPLYNSKSPPEGYPKTREEAKNLLLNYLEKYYCPTTSTHEIYSYTKSKIIYVDIDKTICYGSYEKPEPIWENIEKANQLYDKGYTIIYWTARGCASGKSYHYLTKKQLEEWGVKYHLLKSDKPEYDCFICDKTVNWSGKHSFDESD